MPVYPHNYRYNAIPAADRAAYPISILVNRSAFEVMFPGKLPAGQTPKPGTPTEEMLEALREKFYTLASVSKSVVFARAQPVSVCLAIFSGISNLTSVVLCVCASDAPQSSGHEEEDGH